MATPSRIAVARTLHLVFGEGARVPDAWDAGLPAADAGLANALLGQCLRRWGTLQAGIRPQLKDPARGLPLGTQVVLAIGLAQLAWLPGVSDHAAVNEAVDLATNREVGFPPHKGLVNAILRRAAKDRAALAAELDRLDPALDRSPFTERVLQSALAPRGGSGAEALWHRLQAPPHPHFLQLRAEPLPPGMEPLEAPAGALRLAPDAPFPQQWLAEGAGMVQDLSSQALLGFQWEHPVTRILDACSAPGGKATVLGRRYPQAGITALERNAARARRLRDNLQLRGVPAEIVVEDACAWLLRDGPRFDLIMLDAPCSGSGTLQKHPELNWLGDALDLPRLAQTQRTLLEAALPRLAPGGLLIYAVCSWLPEEGLAHRDRVLAAGGYRPAAIWPAPMGTEDGPTSLFRPDPLAWTGEGFQAFAFTR
ncbi:MAG: transcription antitermination factor NusB [Holophaga sp.]|nr:transcription antitermination factor NusB [Holophaga sp.]